MKGRGKRGKEIQYREYKLLVNPNRFSGEKGCKGRKREERGKRRVDKPASAASGSFTNDSLSGEKGKRTFGTIHKGLPSPLHELGLVGGGREKKKREGGR